MDHRRRAGLTLRLALLSAVSLGALTLSLTAASRGSADFQSELRIPGRKAHPAGSGVQLVQASKLVRAAEARQAYGVDGTGLTCAVLDSGARVTHDDFEGKIIAKRNFTTDDGGDPDNVTDGNGHGTNAAGVVAADGVNTGIAPGANLVILKVANNAGVVSRQAVADALQWVLDHPALNILVVNMSISDGENYQGEAESPGDSLGVATKIRQLRERGVAVVISAGNDFFGHGSAQGMPWPAILPQSISVGGVFDSNVGPDSLEGASAATTGPDRIVPWSQRLHPSLNAVSRTDVFAPGSLMTATGNSGDRAQSTFHGTSEAAPVVSGIILLLQQACRNAEITPTVDQIETWLREGAVPINDGDDEVDNVTNTGLDFLRADALGAIEKAVPGPKLEVVPTELILTALGRRPGRGKLQVKNAGAGVLIVKLRPSRGVGVSPPRLRIEAGQSQEARVSAARSGRVTLFSNGGDAAVPVRLRRVRPR